MSEDEIKRSTPLLVKQLEDHEPMISLVRQECPYQIPKGYMRWDLLSGIIGLMMRVYLDPRYSAHQDQASLLNAQRTALWFVQNAPIYCLDKNLLRAFEQSDIHDHAGLLADLQPPIHTAIVLFPCNSVLDPDGNPIDYAVIHLADRDRPDVSEGERSEIRVSYLPHEHQRNFHWCAINLKETVWFSGIGLESDGTLIESADSIGASQMSTADREFTARIRSVLLQCLMTLAFEPELIDMPFPQSSNPARSRQGRSSTSALHPRWIGRNFTVTRDRTPSHPKTHASPRTHWRKGHWRRVAVGKGRCDRDWKWIRPVLVGS